MDFRKLSYFEAVCRLGNFTNASKELHVTQPSVTMAIKDLEEEFDMILIRRNRNGLFLTPEGEFLYEKARYILSEIDGVTSELHRFALRRSVTLKVVYSIQMRIALFDIIKEFKKINTNLQVLEIESSSPSVIEQVENGIADLGIIVITEDIKNRYNVIPLFEGEILVCVSKKNPLSTSRYMSIEEFEKQPLISLSLNEPKESYIFKVLNDSFKDEKININPALATLQLESYFKHIGNNDGIGLTFSDKWFNASFYNKGVNKKESFVTIPFEKACNYVVGIISHKNQILTKSSKSFIEYLKRLV